MAEPVRARRLTGEEGRRLRQVTRRGKDESIRVRRAMMVMASAAGTPVPAIACLVAADEDTVRDVVHAFNERGLAALDPRWAGGRPRLVSRDDVELIVATARTRPTKLGRPFTHWSLRTLADYLVGSTSRVIRIGRERLRQILHERGISFQRTRPWKTSNDPDFDAKLDRCFAFDQFGPISIRPGHGTSWAQLAKPDRLPAHPRHPLLPRLLLPRRRPAVGRDPGPQGWRHTLAALKSIRAARPDGQPIYLILDNLSANKTPAIRAWARENKVELCLTPTYAS